LVGSEYFYQGVTEQEAGLVTAVIQAFRKGPVAPASVQDVEQADAILVIGEEVLNTAPRLALAIVQAVHRQPAESVQHLDIPQWNDAAIRQAVNERKGPLFMLNHRRTWLDDLATCSMHVAPDDAARLGFAVAHELDSALPAVIELAEQGREVARRVASELLDAKQPAIISGTGALNHAVIQAAARVAEALHARGKPVKLCMTVPECNSIGTALLGGKPLEQAEDALRNGHGAMAIVVENDLLRRPGAGRPPQDGIYWVALDHLENGFTRSADALLPAATFAEADGTLVNHEGRAQRFYQVFIPAGEIQESWRWLQEMARALPPDQRAGREALLEWRGLDDVVESLCKAVPIFRPIKEALPEAVLRVGGRKIPRQPERYSGRTAMAADLTMHEPPPPADPDSPFAFTMEGDHRNVPPPLLPQIWAPRWNSNQALNKFQEEVGGPLRDQTIGPSLIQPRGDGSVWIGAAVPQAFEPRPGEWLVLPRYEIFGGDELSAFAPALATRIPGAAVALNPDEAAGQRWSAGEVLMVTLGRTQVRLPLVTDPSVPPGTAGVSRVGDCLTLPLPGWCRIQRNGAG
jgi:NADH-quinone oxidoreductase subunit G